MAPVLHNAGRSDVTTTTPKAPPLCEGWDSDDQRWYWADLPLTIIPRSHDVCTLAERARTYPKPCRGASG